MLRSITALALLSLGACAEDPSTLEAADALAVDQAGVPAGLPAFAVGEIAPGSPVKMTWADLPSRATVYFLASAATGAGPCHPSLNGQCLDIADPVFVVGSTRANRAGVATLTVTAPASASGSWVWQAVAYKAGMDPILSETYARGVGPGFCPFIFAPVCGVDGNSYDNDCIANAFGTVVDDFGFCP